MRTMIIWASGRVKHFEDLGLNFGLNADFKVGITLPELLFKAQNYDPLLEIVLNAVLRRISSRRL